MAKTGKRARTKKDLDSVDAKPEEPGQKVKKIGRCFEVPGSDSDLDLAPADNDPTIRHFYIELLGNGTVALDLVDTNGDPSGNIVEEGISLDNFTLKYKSCSEHDCPIQSRTVDEIAKRMSEIRAVMGEEHLKNNELDKAEDKFKRSLKFDEDNLQALLGLGKTHMEQDRVEEAMTVFKKISESNTIYEQANKHTFNDFAIYLRKQGLSDQAIENYEKAIMIDPHDEILYYNLGRANWEGGKMQAAIEKIKEGLKIAGDKKLEFVENPKAVSHDDAGFEDDKKYLIESADVATRVLSFYMKREREMLENLFAEKVTGDIMAENAISEVMLHIDQETEKDNDELEDMSVVVKDEGNDVEFDETISDLTVSDLDESTDASGPPAGSQVMVDEDDIIVDKEKPLKLVADLVTIISDHDPKERDEEKIEVLSCLENIHKELQGNSASKKQIVTWLEKAQEKISKLKLLGEKAIASKALFTHFKL